MPRPKLKQSNAAAAGKPGKPRKNVVHVELPKGFKAIEAGGFAKTWDYEAEPLIEATLIGIKEVKKGGKISKDTQVATLKKKDGKEVTVWHSYALEPLFQLKKGKRVAIAFNGYVRIKGRSKPMKDFTVGVA